MVLIEQVLTLIHGCCLSRSTLQTFIKEHKLMLEKVRKERVGKFECLAQQWKGRGGAVTNENRKRKRTREESSRKM